MPPISAAFWDMQLLAFFGALALLVCNAATCLTSRLAGCLALAATAVFSTVAQVTSFDSLDVFHNITSYIQKITVIILSQITPLVKYV